MKRFVIYVYIVCSTVFLPGAMAEERAPTLTHADAAVILAKYSGYFDRYVADDADLEECVAFLNKTGIYFGLMEIVNGSEFTKSDAARALGQVDLVLNGEARYSGGKVRLPKGIESWEEYCTMNHVEYAEFYQVMLKVLQLAGKQKV